LLWENRVQLYTRKTTLMSLESSYPAPEFSANASNGSKISLSDLSGQWVILYFYPKDDTPGCTKEACGFRDSSTRLTGMGATVIGCSPDDLKAHDKFITKYDLPFVLISDPDHKVAEAYGVWKEKNMYGKKIMGIERTTFLISPEGNVMKTWKRVKVDRHVDEIIDELQMLVIAP